MRTTCIIVSHMPLPVVEKKAPWLIAPPNGLGMSQSVSAQQRAIADAMPLKTKQHSKIQRLRRLLDHAKLTAKDVYQPMHALP
jgi:hypothetical protein